MKFIDLFAGLGGFHLALSGLGHKCVFACEIDPDLNRLYQDNFRMDAAFDINDVDVNAIPNHDILCAGFPCQPFSHAGKQEGRNCGKNGNLIDNVIRTLEAKCPKYLLLENVPTLLSHNKGQTFAEIKMALEGLGYYVEHNKYSPRHFGIPQNRPRLFILGVRGRKRISWPEKPSKIKDKPDALKLMLNKIPFQ